MILLCPQWLSLVTQVFSGSMFGVLATEEVYHIRPLAALGFLGCYNWQMAAKKSKKSPIKIKKSKEGDLHAKLGIPKGQKIPAARLQAAAKSKDPDLKKKAQFALNAKKFKH